MLNVATAIHNKKGRPAPLTARDLVAELRARHRRADERKLIELLFERLQEDHDARRAAASFIVRHYFAIANGQERRRAAEPERQHRREETRKQATQIAKTIKERLTLDWMIEPLGKALRFVTGRELRTLGSGFTKLAEKVPPDVMVGECCTEAECQAAICAPETAAG
jgi:hypothetical protein